MSTVDSAIINTISEIKMQSGGAILTSGDGINITNGTINVKYNSNTMELVDGALSAKNGGGSGGGDYMPNYIINDGLDTSMGHLNVKVDNNTIGINNNNALYVKSSSGGGNVPTEDVLEHPLAQSSSFNNSYYTITISSYSNRARTGNIIRLRNRSDEIESFILVMKTDTIPNSQGDSNAIIIAEDGTAYPLCVYYDPIGENVVFAIPASSGAYKEFSSNSDVGLFINKQMSYNTICTILRYSTGVN